MVWIFVLPKLQGYVIRPEVLSLDGTVATHRLVKVPIEQVAEWERTHDPSGRIIVDRSAKEVEGRFSEHEDKRNLDEIHREGGREKVSA